MKILFTSRFVETDKREALKAALTEAKIKFTIKHQIPGIEIVHCASKDYRKACKVMIARAQEIRGECEK
jgi:hypothetical protein